MVSVYVAALDAVILRELGKAARKYVRKRAGVIHEQEDINEYQDDDDIDVRAPFTIRDFYIMLQAAVDYSDRDEKSLLMLCGAELYEMKKSTEDFSDITFDAFVYNVDTISFDKTDTSLLVCFYEKDSSLTLHYYTQFKEPFEYLVIGYLKAVAKDIYCTRVKISVLTRRYGKWGQSVNNYHVSFDIREQEFLYSSSFDVREDSSVKDAVSSDQLDSPCTDQVLEDWPITEEIFQELIPFYLAFDNNLTVYAAGPVIERFRPSLVHKTLEDFFLPVSSTKLIAFEAITLARFKPYTMRCRCGADYCRMTFEGRAIINSDDPSMAVYNCTPTVFTFECLKRTCLSVSDFCYNADNQDRIFLSMHLYTAKIVRENLEATECLLKENYEKIDAQKKKSLDVLYSVLPSFAADKYLQSEDFPPTRFNSLSVLFSDIKGFAQICQNSSPVSTVIMLNNLFNKYDDLTDMHDVLKLENYGDTYIVTGAGRHRSDHPHSLLAMAFDMRKTAITECLPHSSVSLEIRIGIHTGPVVMAILNKNMPHFSMFGHTMNKASRMCSYGMYGKIQISQETHRALAGCSTQYTFESRGSIQVKGLGMEPTYFVEPYNYTTQ